MTLSVWFVLTPNVLLLDYAGPAEALRMAAETSSESPHTIVLHSCSPVPRLRSSLGVEVGGLEALPERLPPHSLVIVAGNACEAEDYGRPEAHAVVAWLRRARLADCHVASICSGALLLAAAGLLDGRRCTTHHSLIESLQAAAPAARVEVNRVFVEDGPVLTSAGITTGIDLALYLIERHAGAELAARVARRLVVYQRRSGNDPQLSPWLAHRNHLHPALHRAQDAIAQDPVRSWSLAELAACAHVSERHLTRLFAEHAGIGVVAYQQRLRIARARELLADRQLSVERVAELAGFSSARDFRRVWQRYESDAPSAGRAAGG
ncbi:helix-turn-helix domain-containing protein [Candidatus Accumulibacter sp. ACC003]|uniref:GlxA family transcriptional regulator n=1 Tax=Candidatus Accumulibacter sp. ACC003 TaxID=2823334 RepID=UPI0025C4BF1B|nr:helix-turn-helix domain-containing protein [Candidatus Accumulibacter sp. ACC003]